MNALYGRFGLRPILLDTEILDTNDMELISFFN
jgi:hypothetical protein